MHVLLLILAASLHLASSFRISFVSGVVPTSRNAGNSDKDTFELVLVRHGESTWNQENKFTGWHDCPLSETGKKEACAAGKLLKSENFKFDVAFTSYLQRAIKTLWIALEESNQMSIPIKPAWQLNERHYGALQGLNKKETADKYGEKQVTTWRRSYDIPPPDCDDSPSSIMFPGNIEKYKHIPDAAKVRAESLKTTLDRVLPYWNEEIAPAIRSGKRVIVAAHGNSLRALVKYLDNIPEDVITELNIPTACPLVYTLDSRTLKPIRHPLAIAPLSARYLGDQEAIRAKILGVKNQTK